MNLDDIMNENIEDVVRVSVVERAKLPEQERKSDDETIRSEKSLRKAAPAVPADETAGRKRAEAVSAGESAVARRRKTEAESAEETVAVKRKKAEAIQAEPEPVRATEKPARKQSIEEDKTPAYGLLAYDDDDDDDDDDEVVYGAFDDDSDDDPESQEEYDEEKSRGFLRTVIADYLFLPIAFLIALLIFYVFPPYIVDGPSMQKTLDDKAFGFGFRYAKPERGDIVIVNTGEDGGTGGASFIKRVIGVPGDTIFCTYETYEYDVTLSDGMVVKAGEPVYRVYLNGEMMYEPYVWFGDKNIARTTEKPVTLGEDEYFIMGDNRFNSNDSRAFGPITRSDIKCTMMFFLFGKHNPE